jgi:hypothetical protein
MNSDPLPTPEEREVEGITNSAVSHPVGKTLGATGGALAGAAAGMAAGPAGIALGATIGAVAGGVLGNATAAAISPTEEELYWSDNHPGQAHAHPEDDFEDFRPAYRLGATGPTRHGNDFEAAENALRAEWEQSKGNSRLDWERARPAARAAWDRVTRGPAFHGG